MGADPSVVKRTQLYESKQCNKIPIQYAAYFCMGSLIYLIGAMIFAFNMFIFTKFSFGVRLLENVSFYFTRMMIFFYHEENCFSLKFFSTEFLANRNCEKWKIIDINGLFTS